jgi:hypothetical protein
MLEDGAPEENYQDEGELAARDASLLSQDEIHHEVRVRRCCGGREWCLAAHRL